MYALPTMTEKAPTFRRAARVLLLDSTNRVLLMGFATHGRRWWCAPGGGLKDGESYEDAARREAAEETGFDIEEVGPWVWTREHVFEFGGRFYRQLERYFLTHVPPFEPRPRDLGAEEASVYMGLRWWTLRELANAGEGFAPADLPALVRALAEDGPPERPIEVGA